jgi:hypothetical protein
MLESVVMLIFMNAVSGRTRDCDYLGIADSREYHSPHAKYAATTLLPDWDRDLLSGGSLRVN